MDKTYLIDKFITTTPGEPYRLLPFGKIEKGGITRDITPLLASQFKLPPFFPPIKLGSHDEATPAGGQMTRLEVREDGLWVYPEMTEKGAKAMSEGDYRYHSPEIIWPEGALVTNEGTIPGPLIIGDALLHMPYLGEATAFYTTDEKEIDMTENIVNVPISLWEKIITPLLPQKPEPVAPVTMVPEDYEATKTERDEFKAKVAKIEADAKHTELLTAIVKDLQVKDKFGSMYIEMAAATDAAAMMASMTPEQRDWCMKNFSALVKQIDESKLTGEQGTEGQASTDPKAEFNAAVLAIVVDKKLTYNAAFEQAKAAQADLFAAAFKKL